DNPVAGKTVGLTSNRGVTDTISPPSGPSDASGVVTFTVTSTTAGSPLFTADDTTDTTTITQTAAVSFTPGLAAAANSTISPATATITANGTSTQVITVQAKDGNGNNLTAGGAVVSITKSAGTGAVGSTIDNSNGTYTAIVTSPTVTGSG